MRSNETKRRGERGVILFVAALMLALMGALGVAALDSAATDRQAAGYYNRSNTALFAAEAGVARARDLIGDAKAANNFSFCPGTLPFPGVNNKAYIGDTSSYAAQGNRPRFYGDPAFPDAIRCESPEAIGLSRRGSQVGATKAAPFIIHVVGESPDGSRVRLQVYHREEF